MKKFSAILLFTIYALTTLGIGIRQFYCCGKLKSTSITLVQEAKEKCSNKGGMKDCCKTQFKSIKAKDSHVGTDGLLLPAKPLGDYVVHTSQYQLHTPTCNAVVITNASHAPPPKLHGVAAYIFNCTYLI